MNSVPIVLDVCLVGGGHCHVLMIRRWAMRPLPGVRLTLISSTIQTPYSGMLPGLIAGHYAEDEIHVDLLRLCAWAGIRFVEDTVVGLDLQSKYVHFEHRPSIGFDVLSLDTGSTPDLSVPGSRQFVTPVKPVHNFYARWQEILNRINQPITKPLAIGVVGSGAGGFELVCAMRHVLPCAKARCYWFVRETLPIRGRPDKVGNLALNAARRNGIEIVSDFNVARVKSREILAVDGREYELDEILWCTAATGPVWPGESGLTIDERGFVATCETLQSISHPFVFASGDIGTQLRTPSAKAGVYAVRQAPILFENIRRFILGQKLKSYVPQRDFLSLMATGGKCAIASRGPIIFEADWVWRWKDHIDQRFMQQFRQLPAMSMNPALARLPDVLRATDELAEANAKRCRGCGAKVGSDILESVISSLNPIECDDLKSGVSAAGDAAVIGMSNVDLVQSVDQINAIVDDPYLLGKIAVYHALSDVYTLNVKAVTAQALVTLPEGSKLVVERDLRLLMAGLIAALNEEGCALIGGHTTEGAECSVGLVINAAMQPPIHRSRRLKTQIDANNSDWGVRSGDVIVLTQALGIGTLFAGLMQQKSRGEDISIAMQAMLHSNREASIILRRHDARIMTDVTGFGLMRHLQLLLHSLPVGAEIYAERVPLLPGAMALSRGAVRSSMWRHNSQILRDTNITAGISKGLVDLLCDPQTSGGLLAVVPMQQLQQCIYELRQANYLDASDIGVITDNVQFSIAP